MDAGGSGYRFLFEHHPHALFIYERCTLRILDVNDAALELYGYERDAFLALSIADIRPGEDVAALREYLDGARSGLAHAGVWRHQRRDGTVFDVEVSSHDVECGGKPARLVTVVDVSARRRTEIALRESERRFRSLLESVDLIAVTLDVSGCVSFINDYALTLTGYQREEVIGRDWFQMLVPEDERQHVEHSFKQKLATGDLAARDENHIVTRRGEPRLIQWTNTVLRAPDGQIVGTASIGADITVQRRAERRRMYDAFHDDLTGLPNRAVFLDRLEGAIARARRDPGGTFAVLFADIDGFHVVNEGMGHAAGDELIKAMGQALQGGVEVGDTVARLSGDEFGILLEHVDGSDAVVREVMRIQSSLGRPFAVRGRDVYANITIGVVCGTGADAADAVLRNAAVALTRAKRRGERWAVFEPTMRERAVHRFELDVDLRRALERDDELYLVYQPIVALDTEAPVGFEALLRWRHPQRGDVSPGQFVPIAEESGLIEPLGRWVMRAACRQLGQWSVDIGDRRLYMSVNVSTLQLGAIGVTRDIDASLRDAGIDASQLQLEITESSLMDDPEAAISILSDLRERGIGLAIDDFGTGFSSLSYLAQFPLDVVKIDRSFVSRIEDGGLSIVETITSLARNLELTAVAEGIEERTQVAPLQRAGCEYGQGYLFARPMVAADALRYLQRNRGTARMPKLSRP